MHPVLFDLFGYPVHLYAVMIALGFVFGIWLAVSYGEKQGLDRAMLLDLGWWIIVSGLVGSRLAFIVVEWKQYYYPCFDVPALASLPAPLWRWSLQAHRSSRSSATRSTPTRRSRTRSLALRPR